MNGTETKQLTDKERATDVLTWQKYLTGTYNNYANEAATPAVREAFLKILNEEHDIQCEVWSEMNSRDWYPTETAEDQKIRKEKQKFENFCVSCSSSKG